MRLLQALADARKMKTEKNKKVVFDIINFDELPIKCEWVDIEEGVFKMEGNRGFLYARDELYRDPQVRNMRIENK